MIINLNRPEFRRTAFTLNELVVVVAIVATIPGILLPALERSKTETIAQLTIRDSALPQREALL